VYQSSNPTRLSITLLGEEMRTLATLALIVLATASYQRAPIEEMTMKLEVSGDRTVISPSEADLFEAITTLDAAEIDCAFLILG
jgi:hypothetical protein